MCLAVIPYPRALLTQQPHRASSTCDYTPCTHKSQNQRENPGRNTSFVLMLLDKITMTTWKREKAEREKRATRWRRLTIWFSFWPWFLKRKVIVFGTINAAMIRTLAMENTVSIAFTRGHQVRFWALSWNNLCRNMRVRFSFRSQGQRPFSKFWHDFWAVKHCQEQIWPFSRAISRRMAPIFLDLFDSICAGI